jgi:quercetin dioxygenase-like cupin family protein
MKMTAFPLVTTDWSQVVPVEHAGEQGRAIWRTLNFGEIRVRMVEYSAGYEADHWCSKGHILLCLEGELETRLSDGRQFTLKPGMSYQVGDGDPPHRSSTRDGAKLFIVD